MTELQELLAEPREDTAHTILFSASTHRELHKAPSILNWECSAPDAPPTPRLQLGGTTFTYLLTASMPPSSMSEWYHIRSCVTVTSRQTRVKLSGTAIEAHLEGNKYTTNMLQGGKFQPLWTCFAISIYLIGTTLTSSPHAPQRPHKPYFLFSAAQDRAAVRWQVTKWFISCSGTRLISNRFQ